MEGGELTTQLSYIGQESGNEITYKLPHDLMKEIRTGIRKGVIGGC